MIFILSAIIVLIDQLSKIAAVKYLMGKSPFVIIKDYFVLHYVENYGAAFGILQQQRWLFIVITSLVILFLIYYMMRNYYDLTRFTRISLAFLLAGAIGNYIDRFRLGYVIDFLSFNLFKSYEFPVFNIADIFVVVGTIFIVYLVLFDKYEA